MYSIPMNIVHFHAKMVRRNRTYESPVWNFMPHSMGRAASLLVLTLIASYPGFSQIAPNRYTLVLEDQPVAERFVGREAVQSSAAVDYRQQIEAKQMSLRSSLASTRIQVTGYASTFANAIFVTATRDQAASLASLPGVKAVVPQHIFKRKLNRVGALMDLAPAWTAVGGSQNAGKGIKIGIIDSGIDITHPALQDSSLSAPSGFPKCNVASDCTNFTNSKVIVARSYVTLLAAPSSPSNPALDDRPDDYTARDRDGHGTALAVAAAGNAVSSTNNINISGIAPKAFLGSYKIFGSPGVNDETTDAAITMALEDAVKDGYGYYELFRRVVRLRARFRSRRACDHGWVCNSSKRRKPAR